MRSYAARKIWTDVSEESVSSPYRVEGSFKTAIHFEGNWKFALNFFLYINGGHAVAQLVEAPHYTSRKVAGSIPYFVIGIFHWDNPSGRTMALGSTQPVTEMSTTNISCGVKAVGAYGWQPYRLHVLTVLKSASLNLLEPSGPVQDCNGIASPLPLHYHHTVLLTEGVYFNY